MQWGSMGTAWGGATCKWAQLFKFFILSSIALLGETLLVTGGWDTDALPLVWLVFSLVNAFANASAAPAKTSVTDSFRDFLGTLPENAGMSGGFSMTSCKFEHIIVDHGHNLGVSKLLPCFSLRSSYTVSTSSSSSCCLDALAFESRFCFEHTSPLLSDCLPSHQSIISPVRDYSAQSSDCTNYYSWYAGRRRLANCSTKGWKTTR